MGRKKVDNPKNHKITVWCTEKEKKILTQKAKMCGVKRGPFLRNLAMEYPLRSLVDQYAIDELLKVRADLGRLGGLFKIWLTNNQDNTELMLGNRSYKNIDEIVDDIEDKEKEIIEIAKKLIKGIK